MEEINTPATATYITIVRTCYDNHVIDLLAALAPHALNGISTTDWFQAKDLLKLKKKYKLDLPYYTDAATLNSHLEAFFHGCFEVQCDGFMAEQLIDRHAKNPPMKIRFKRIDPATI